MIRFSYEGRNYVVDRRAYEIGRIVLPNGKLLDVEGWHETNPPKPMSLKEVNLSFNGLVAVDFRAEPDQVAIIFNGVLAHKAGAGH